MISYKQFLSEDSNQEYPTSVHDVNRALKENGFPNYKLRHGKGYYYWDANNKIPIKQHPSSWHDSSVMIYHVSQMKTQDWLNDFRSKKENHENF